MSAGLIKKFRESVFEIFSNAVLHSRTKLGIFSCGQFFPNRHQLDFSVVDLGVDQTERERGGRFRFAYRGGHCVGHARTKHH